MLGEKPLPKKQRGTRGSKRSPHGGLGNAVGNAEMSKQKQPTILFRTSLRSTVLDVMDARPGWRETDRCASNAAACAPQALGCAA